MKLESGTIIEVLWDKYQGKISINEVIHNIILPNYFSYDGWQHHINTRTRYQKIEDWVSSIKEVIKHLNNNNIPWKGGNCAFRDGNSLGYLFVTEDYLNFIYLGEDGTTKTQVYSLGNKKLS